MAFKILTREQILARRHGKRMPEITYVDDQGKPMSVIDPSQDELPNDVERGLDEV